MKNLKEKELLVNFARAMGQDIDPRLAEEVDRINSIRNSVRASVSENIFKDLGTAVTSAKNESVNHPLVKPVVSKMQFPIPPSLDELLLVLNEQIEEAKNELVQTSPREEVPNKEILPDPTPTSESVPEQSLAERAAKLIKEAPKDSYQQPDPLVVPNDLDSIRGKLRFLEQWIGKVSMAGPGGGAGSVAKLDHETKLVNTSTYGVSTKDYYVGINYAGPVTITLPTIINDGKMYIIKDESGHCSSNPITVQGTVDNDTGGFILAQDNGGIQLIYRNGWRIV